MRGRGEARGSLEQQSDVIIANCHSNELDDVTEKLYSRDLLARD